MQAALAILIAGLVIAGYAVWRMGGDHDLVIGWFFAVVFLVGAVLFVVGLLILMGVGLWNLFG